MSTIPELIKLLAHWFRENKFDEVQNILVERERNMNMQLGNLMRECESLRKQVDFLERTQSYLDLEKCSLEENLGRSGRRCEELDKKVIQMGGIIDKLSKQKWDVEEKLERSLWKCEELRREAYDANQTVEELKRKEIEADRVVQELQRKNDELRVKGMESDRAAQVYKSRLDDLEPMILNVEENLARVLNVNVANLVGAMDKSSATAASEGDFPDFVENRNVNVPVRYGDASLREVCATSDHPGGSGGIGLSMKVKEVCATSDHPGGSGGIGLSMKVKELVKLKFNEVQNIMIEREKHMEMEMQNVVKERDSLKKELHLLEITQQSTISDKCNLEEKLKRSERECKDMESKHEDLRVKKLEKHVKLVKKHAKLLDSTEEKEGEEEEEEEQEEEEMGREEGEEDAMSPQAPSGLSKKGPFYAVPVTVNRRCDLEIINNIKKNLHHENLEIFEKSCFGHLLKMDKLQYKFQGQLILHLVLHMDKYASNKERGLVFKINNSSMEFLASDFSVITGLHVGTSEPTKTSSSFHKDVFQSRPWLWVTDIKKAFLTVSRENEGRGELALKLALLYFLYGILLPRSGRITSSDMKYLHFVEDLDEFNAFPWGRIAYQFLVKFILLIRDRMDAASQVSNLNISGFAYALQVWAYEAMPSVAAYCGINVGNLTPRILSWSATKVFRFKQLEKLFKPGTDLGSKKSMIMGVDELREETMESDQHPIASGFSKKGVETEDCSESAVVGDQDNVGKKHEIRGSTSLLNSDNQGKEPQIRGSEGEVPFAWDHAVISLSDRDDEIPDFRRRSKRNIRDEDSPVADCKKKSKPVAAVESANDMDASDDEWFSDSHMKILAEELLSKTKNKK